MATSIPLKVTDAFDFATRDGAIALGLDHLVGNIAVGKRADLVLFRTAGLHRMPQTPDPVASIVLQSRPSDIATVLIDSVVRKAGGTLVAVDMAALRWRAQASGDYLTAAARDAAERTGSTATASVYAAGITKMTA